MAGYFFLQYVLEKSMRGFNGLHVEDNKEWRKNWKLLLLGFDSAWMDKHLGSDGFSDVRNTFSV